MNNEIFDHWWSSPYRELLVPIPPRTADLSHWPKAERPSAGKSRAIIGPDGKWQPYHQMNMRVPDRATMERAVAAGGGIGLRTGLPVAEWGGASLVGFDVDAENAEVIDIVVRATIAVLGPSVRRIGKAPRVLLAYRMHNAPKTRNWELGYLENDRPRSYHLDILGRDLHFVAEGRHRLTGALYTWPDGPLWAVRPEDVPLITMEDLERSFEACVAALEDYSGSLFSPTAFAGLVNRFKLRWCPWMPPLGLLRNLPRHWLATRFPNDARHPPV